MIKGSPIDVADAQSQSGKTDIRVGLIGHGIQLSRTPRMHMDEGAVLGLNYSYELFDTALMSPEPPLEEMLAEAEAKGFAGLNITHPFKQAVLEHLDELSSAARAVSAANTVVFRDGKRYGHNTDYWGFAEAFRRMMADAPKARVLLLGAGGAGGAVAHALVDNGVEHLAIFDPNTSSATRLAGEIGARLGNGRVWVASDVENELRLSDGVVNASPIGMASHPGSPVPLQALTAEKWVGDIIYFPLETQLLAAARAKGCRTLDGSGMAVYQAVRAFELFSGVKPDPDRMRAAFDAFTTDTAGRPGGNHHRS